MKKATTAKAPKRPPTMILVWLGTGLPGLGFELVLVGVTLVLVGDVEDTKVEVKMEGMVEVEVGKSEEFSW